MNKLLDDTRGVPFEWRNELNWLARVAVLPGKAPISVALALVALAHRLDQEDELMLTPANLARYGLSRSSAYRGLAALESAGLVTVDRRNGCSPLVTIVVVKHQKHEATSSRSD